MTAGNIDTLEKTYIFESASLMEKHLISILIGIRIIRISCIDRNASYNYFEHLTRLKYKLQKLKSKLLRHSLGTKLLHSTVYIILNIVNYLLTDMLNHVSGYEKLYINAEMKRSNHVSDVYVEFYQILYP